MFPAKDQAVKELFEKVGHTINLKRFKKLTAVFPETESIFNIKYPAFKNFLEQHKRLGKEKREILEEYMKSKDQEKNNWIQNGRLHPIPPGLPPDYYQQKEGSDDDEEEGGFGQDHRQKRRLLRLLLRAEGRPQGPIVISDTDEGDERSSQDSNSEFKSDAESEESDSQSDMIPFGTKRQVWEGKARYFRTNKADYTKEDLKCDEKSGTVTIDREKKKKGKK